MCFSTIINKIKSKKLMFILLSASLITFISTFWYPLIILATLILVVGALFLDFNDLICEMIYETMFSCFIVPFVASAIACFFKLVIIYIKDLKHKNIKFLKAPFIITCIISVLYCAIFYDFDIYGFGEGFLIICLLFLLFFMITYKNQLEFSKYFNYLFLGFVVSLILAVFCYVFPTTKTLFFNEGTFFMIPMKQLVAADGSYRRIGLLTCNVNRIANLFLFLIAFSICYLFNHKCEKREYINYGIIIASSIVMGILTISKAFFIILIFEVLFTIVWYSIKHKKQRKIVLLFSGLFIVVLCLIFHKQLFAVIERFFVYKNDTFLATITTGRSGIWQTYSNAIIESPLKLLFGFGFFSAHKYFEGPHSFYLFILFRFGLVGILLLGILAYNYIRCFKNKFRLNFENILLLLVFLIIGLQETCVDERFYFLIIGILLIFKNKSTNNNMTTNLNNN